MTDKELLELINKAAYQVRLHLTPGYLESVYQNALMLELKNLGLHVQREVPLNVIYKNEIVGEFRADIVVENRIIIELKAVRELNPIHETQLINYLTTTGMPYGVLINFGADRYAFRVKTKDYQKKNNA